MAGEILKKASQRQYTSLKHIKTALSQKALEKPNAFIPFIQERDSMGRIL